ncbi:MAG TPA: hypothetical protein VHF22_14415, partial [Planctomycetota bacterium]|nr:hypothetical protein [Planctomycetota bacterium]
MESHERRRPSGPCSTTTLAKPSRRPVAPSVTTPSIPPPAATSIRTSDAPASAWARAGAKNRT